MNNVECFVVFNFRKTFPLFNFRQSTITPVNVEGKEEILTKKTFFVLLLLQFSPRNRRKKITVCVWSGKCFIFGLTAAAAPLFPFHPLTKTKMLYVYGEKQFFSLLQFQSSMDFRLVKN